jgi:hypothetical protein
MNDVEAFDLETADLGGLYRTGSTPTEIETRVLYLFNWLINHAKVTQSEANCEFRPYFGLIANHDVNAIPFRNHLGASCVGLYFGAIQALDGLFCRIFADPRTFPEVGKVELEAEQPALAAPYIETLTNPMLTQRPPQCPERRWWADACTKQALRFLLRHELVHVAHGHVDFLAKQVGLQVVSELDWGEVSLESLFDRQTLEFDADCCAASWWCGVFLDEYFGQAGISDPKQITASEIEAKYLKELGGAFFQWSFSVSALFRLFGDAGFSGQQLRQAAYPPLRLRQTAVLRTALDHVRGRYNWDLANELTPAVGDGLDAAEFSFECVTGSERSVNGLRDAFGEAGNKHIDAIIDHWKSSLRPRLLPFSLGGGLPT